MSWIFLVLVAVALAVAVVSRRREMAELDASLRERDHAKERGSARARLQHPEIDLAHCIGCGACVRACPEDDVLGLVHGQAVVLHGARCVGHGLCAEACPVGALAVTLADLSDRRDIPALDDNFESLSMPGVFLAGEVTGYALVRTAVSQGVTVASEVGRRIKLARQPGVRGEAYDLCIVGAGPAGLACALRAKELGLSFVVLEQEGRDGDGAEGVGGTVAKYPRRKLVMTQPVELPLYGKLDRSSYTKEELVEIWKHVVREFELPIVAGQTFAGLSRDEDGVFRLRSSSRIVRALNVCFALGRRGTPNKLNVQGEELSKVAYGLIDAQSFQDRRILVVGGGDSAVEAALGLAEQPGNAVTLSYRKSNFFRLRSRNEARLREALESKKLHVLLESEVRRIEADSVELAVGAQGADRCARLENDEVFVFAGGRTPFELLESAGVSFDPALRKPIEARVDNGRGLGASLTASLAVTLAVLAWTFWHFGYYRLDAAGRALHADHDFLRPSGTLGVVLGVTATVFVLANLAYLARREWRRAERLGSLRAWMLVHVATGVLAFVFALVHSAFAPHATVGGHALQAMGFLVITGAVGRYFYSLVPRAANGRELELDEVKSRLADLSGEWDRVSAGFGERVRSEIAALVARSRPKGAWFSRAISLIQSRRAFTRTLDGLLREGAREGIGGDELAELRRLAERAHKNAVGAAHFEELRSLIGSWRWFHRWVALMLVLLIVLHVIAAFRFGGLGGGT